MGSIVCTCVLTQKGTILKAIVVDFLNLLNRKSYRHSLVFFVSVLILPECMLYAFSKGYFLQHSKDTKTWLLISNRIILCHPTSICLLLLAKFIVVSATEVIDLRTSI